MLKLLISKILKSNFKKKTPFLKIEKVEYGLTITLPLQICWLRARPSKNDLT